MEKETKDKRILPESQSGFEGGRSTIDNIFILNHLVQREKESGKGKKDEEVFAFFMDLKAAFDNVKREVLWIIMENKGIDKRLISRIKKIYEETISVIRYKDVCTDKFWIWKRIRQGCVLRSLLFNFYIADIDKEINKGGIGGLAVGGNRIWTIAYADDIVILAKNGVALLNMMDTLGRFLKDRELTLSAEKSKILVFNKKGRKKIEKWKWKNKDLQEVKEFKYLGFTFNREGNYSDHIKDLIRKDKMVAKKVWGLRETICRYDFGRRWYLFKYLIQSVMEYGVKIWGWEEKKELEKIMLDYTRWLFNLDFCTPRYIILRELCMSKLCVGY